MTYMTVEKIFNNIMAITITKLLKKLEKTGYVKRVRCYSTGHERALEEGDLIVATTKPLPRGVAVHVESSKNGTILIVGDERRDTDQFDYWYLPLTFQKLAEIVEFLTENEVEIPDRLGKEIKGLGILEQINDILEKMNEMKVEIEEIRKMVMELQEE